MRSQCSRNSPSVIARSPTVCKPNQCTNPPHTVEEHTDDQDHDQYTMLAQRPSRDNFDRVASIAREAYEMAKVIRGELNVEKYMFATGSTVLLTSITWGNGGVSPTLMNGIPQGDQEGNRAGDSIKMTSLMMDLRVNTTRANPFPTNVNDYVKLVIFYVPGTNVISTNFGTSAGDVAGLLENSYVSSVLAPFAPRDYDGNSKGKCQILHEHLFKLSAENPDQHHRAIVRLNKKTQFENNTTVVNTGGLFYTLVGDSTASVTNASFQFRLHYVDN
jgi:hypothetical protein